MCVSIEFVFVLAAILHALCISRVVSLGTVNSRTDCQQQMNYEMWKVARFEVITAAFLKPQQGPFETSGTTLPWTQA